MSAPAALVWSTVMSAARRMLNPALDVYKNDGQRQSDVESLSRSGSLAGIALLALPWRVRGLHVFTRCGLFWSFAGDCRGRLSLWLVRPVLGAAHDESPPTRLSVTHHAPTNMTTVCSLRARRLSIVRSPDRRTVVFRPLLPQLVVCPSAGNVVGRQCGILTVAQRQRRSVVCPIVDILHMPSTRKLSLEYEWRQEGDQHILHLGEHALIQIDPDRDVWVLRSLLKAPGITPLRFAVRTVEIGKSKAESWTMERQHIIAHACGRDDLVALLPYPTPRLSYAWELANWMPRR